MDKSVSCYFFDFDDNLMFLETPIFVRHNISHETKSLTTAEFASVRQQLGEFGEWADYEEFDGTYNHFRDRPAEEIQSGKQEYLLDDIDIALAHSENWKAPAWKLFEYACENERPLAIVTARGHSRKTIKSAIKLLYERELITKLPNYLAVYAVSNEGMIQELIDTVKDPTEKEQLQDGSPSTSALKRVAIHNVVDLVAEKYGTEYPHRFGMSDDDPKNIDLIIKAMCDCKKKYIEMRFFVINTHEGEHVKLEVFPVDFPVTGSPEHDLCLE